MGSFKSKLMNMASLSSWASFEPEANDKVKENNDNEVPAYGPWLLVSYGRQGNRGYKCRNGWTGNGNVGAPMNNTTNGKPSGSDLSNVKRNEGDPAGNMVGKTFHEKSGAKPKSGVQASNKSTAGVKNKGKVVLIEITNQKSSQSNLATRIPS
ncbi:hypothetical protein Q3G72_008950 [Acer saccharum]|nr:hypothetical protein Q3G72_008950 [Acer saccharum]